MAQEDPSRLGELWALARAQFLVARQHLEDWLSAVREEPVLLWQTPAVRYSVYGLAAIVLMQVVLSVVGLLVPPPAADAQPMAKTADFHVLCSSAECGHHFVIHRKFGFSRFPVECPKCRQATGMAARRCSSGTCRGRWVVPRQVENQAQCPDCGSAFE